MSFLEGSPRDADVDYTSELSPWVCSESLLPIPFDCLSDGMGELRHAPVSVDSVLTGPMWTLVDDAIWGQRISIMMYFRRVIKLSGPWEFCPNNWRGDMTPFCLLGSL